VPARRHALMREVRMMIFVFMDMLLSIGPTPHQAEYYSCGNNAETLCISSAVI
jgi:hypothetical protein